MMNTQYTVKNDGIYLDLIVSNELQVKIKGYIDNCILEIEKNNINLFENHTSIKKDESFNFIQNEPNNDLRKYRIII